jgi:class 3 adenylate cyclase
VQSPETRYAKSGDVSVAYQVLGDGPYDLVFVPPGVSNVEMVWEVPPRAEGNRRLAELSRLILLDKRGTGLSDRIPHAATLEERMDDVRAVLDAVGSERAAVLGIADGAPMSILFAATYPERCFALALYDCWARWSWAPDYPWAPPREELETQIRRTEAAWGTEELARQTVARLWPEQADDPALIAAMARFARQSASPGAYAALMRMNNDIDVRDVLPAVRVPTVVFERGDGGENAPHTRYVAERIPGARTVRLEDHGAGLFGNTTDVYDALRDFLDDAWARGPDPMPDRILATVLFTDIVDSTAKAVELGDRAWAQLIATHHERVRRELARFRGRELDTAGDGFFAAFDGPARAIRCAAAIHEAVRDLGLEVRAGLHTGECEEVDGKVAGVAVVTGARVAALARSGEVLVSATVRDLVAGSGIAFADRGLHQLKGLPEERRLFAVVAAGS